MHEKMLPLLSHANAKGICSGRKKAPLQIHIGASFKARGWQETNCTHFRKRVLVYTECSKLPRSGLCAPMAIQTGPPALLTEQPGPVCCPFIFCHICIHVHCSPRESTASYSRLCFCDLQLNQILKNILRLLHGMLIMHSGI